MANGTEAARIRAETALDVQASRERMSERKAAEDLYNGLALGQQETLGKVWQEKSESAQDLRELRVKRTSAFAKAAADYYRSRDSGGAAERLRTLRGLYDSALKNSVDIVDAAFTPNRAMVDRLKNSVPGFGTEGFDISNPANRKAFWTVVADEARAGGPGAAGFYDYAEGLAGSPDQAGFAPGDPVFKGLSELGKQRDRAFKEARENDAKAKGFLQSYDKWAAQNNRNPSDPASVDAYVAAQKLGAKDIPLPGSSVIDLFGQIASNPAQYELPFSDIDPLIKQAEEAERVAKKEFLEFKPEEPEEEKAPQPELTEREMLVGWLSRPDVQAWAQRQGFNLGTVRDITPEVQAEIDAGRYPQGMAVRGKLYVSAPDDMRAVRAAARQMGIDPQKNLFYRMGIGDRTRRGNTVVRVRTQAEVRGPAVKPVAASVDDDGVLLVEGADGEFYESKDGETFSLKTTDKVALRARMRNGDPVAVDGFPPIPGSEPIVRPEQVQEFTIREEGPLYGADTGFEGGVVGVDRTPGSPTFGQRVQIAASDIVQRERIGLAPVRQTVAEQIMFKGAQRAEKKRAAEEKKTYGDMARAGEGPKGEDRPVTEEERAESERTGAEIQAALDAMSEQERAQSPEAIAALKAREGVLAVEYNNALPEAREAIAQQLNATTAKRQAAERAQAAAPPAVPEQVGVTKPVEELARTAGSVGEDRRPTTLQGVPTIPSAEQVNVGAPASGLLRPATGGPITFEKPAGEAEGAKRDEDIDTTTKPPAQPSAQRAAFGAAARRRPAATPASAPATSTV